MTSDAYARLDLTGRVAIVTGSSRGIGAATVSLLRGRGATVVEVSRTVEPGPDRHRADVSSPEDCERIIAEITARHPRVNILINNAGVGGFGLDTATATNDDWDRVMGVNAKSMFMLTRGLLPALEGSADAVVVNVASVHALATAPGVSPYAASKGAALALTRGMAIDLAPRGVRVMAVLPGATDTEMLHESAERAGKSFEELGFSSDPNSVSRIMSAEEVAEVVVFAASPAASGILGSAVTVDAGLLAGF